MICNRPPEIYLGSHEIHIWSAYLPDNEKNISYFTSVLSKDECQRANSFKFPKDTTSFIIARGILRCLLGRYLGFSPQEIEIVYGLWGKPCVAYYPLYFNLSHSRNYVLYAMARSCEVGIDIEYIDPTLDVEEMALHILSPQELSFWRNIKADEKINTFFKLWTCKEAFLKASGKGWLTRQHTLPVEVLEIINNTKKTEHPNQSIESAQLFDFIPGYVGSFFIDGSASRSVYYTWEPLE